MFGMVLTATLPSIRLTYRLVSETLGYHCRQAHRTRIVVDIPPNEGFLADAELNREKLFPAQAVPKHPVVLAGWAWWRLLFPRGPMILCRV